MALEGENGVGNLGDMRGDDSQPDEFVCSNCRTRVFASSKEAAEHCPTMGVTGELTPQ